MLWFVKVEVNVIKFFIEGTSIRQSTDFIDEEMSGSMSFTIRAEGDLDFVYDLIEKGEDDI